jgi:hypothetical protein
MSRRAPGSSGLEAAPDVMLLTMSGLMVSLVWLSALTHEQSVAGVDVAGRGAQGLSASDVLRLFVTLRSVDTGVDVFVGERRLAGGIDELAEVLARADARTRITLRAEGDVPWSEVLEAMSAAARLDLPVSVAPES